jgi:hypothetical protein
MTRSTRAALVALLLPLAIGATPPNELAAQDDKPIQIALFNPIQIFDAQTSITGIRWNLIWGKNANVSGIDFGLINEATGDVLGLQGGLVNNVGGNVTGWQQGAVNLTRGLVQGVQAGFYSQSLGTEGVMWSGINNTRRMQGLQVGIVNIADDMDGLQLGLVNIIRSKDRFPVLPFVNWKFDG